MVSSVLELYTTGYGWALYNLFFGLFASTGILAYPFMMLIYESWRNSSENASTVSMSSMSSVQLIKWRLLMAVLVFTIAVIPSRAVSFGNIYYNQACNIDGTTNTDAAVTQGNDTSTFNDLTAPTTVANIKVPIIWSLTMAISGGFNNFVVNDIPCFPDLTGLDSALRSVVIDDADVHAEYDQFVSWCYAPALSRYQNATGPFLDSIQTTRATLDISESELIEIDSELFKAVPGLYQQCGGGTGTCPGGLKSLQSANPVRGFEFNEERDAGYSAIQAGEDGSPYCDEWWTSLRGKIADSAVTQETLVEGAKTKVTTAFTWLKNFGPFSSATEEEIDKLTIRAAVRNTPHQFTEIYAANRTSGGILANLDDISPVVTDNIGSVMAAGGAVGALALGRFVPGVGGVLDGIAGTVAGWLVFISVAVKAAPMMQAMVLMFIYAFLPIYLVFSRYEVSAMITGIALIFTVRIFTSVFEISRYIEDSLFGAMYPDISLTGSVLTMGIDRVVLAMVTAMLVFIAPLLLLQIVNLAGQNIGGVGGSGADSQRNIAGQGTATGRTLGSGATSIATGQRASTSRLGKR